MIGFYDLIAKSILRAVDVFIRIIFGDQYYVKAYSQEGEDMILHRIFERKQGGFYVDVGAHHPKRFSNTYLFYLKGWSGINIDAMPGSMNIFRMLRKRDINIEAAIAKDKKEMTFYIFNEPALNTFDLHTRNEHAVGRYFVVREQKMQTETLENVLQKHLPRDKKIDFMSIDVEGLDLEVLQSNNWKLFRPQYILVESLYTTLKDVEESEIYQFLNQQEYDLFAKTFYTIIFKERQV